MYEKVLDSGSICSRSYVSLCVCVFQGWGNLVWIMKLVTFFLFCPFLLHWSYSSTVNDSYNLSASLWNLKRLRRRICWALGLVVAGVGEKGFQTVELKLVGPILLLIGGFLVCSRVIFCFLVFFWCQIFIINCISISIFILEWNY